jgi:membrane associated rhomboid family serine protease
MFPIRDHNPSNRTPFVTYVLIAANVLIFLSYVPVLDDERALYAMFWDYALIPGKLMEGGSWHPLVTSMFLHGGWMHLIGNMLFLWIFGDNMEDFFGHLGFALFYLACGIGAGLVQVAAAPWSDIPTVGASGAIAGVLGGYLLLFPKARVDILFIFIVFFKVIPIPAWVMLGVWFGLQLFNGVTTSTDGGGVAYWAHIGGFVFGFLFTVPFWRRRGGTGYWQASHGHPPHPDAEYKFAKSHIPTVKRRR